MRTQLRVPRLLWLALTVSAGAVAGAVVVLFGKLEDWR